MRYYSTQRPIMPGSYPKPAGNPVVEIRNFDARVFCGEIGREALGYIEYEQALFPGQAQSYELILAPGQEKRCFAPVTAILTALSGAFFFAILMVAYGSPSCVKESISTPLTV